MTFHTNLHRISLTQIALSNIINSVCIFTLLVINHQTTYAAEAIYPTKPIRRLVGFPPGGGADITARTIAPKLTERFQQQVIIDNRPGASGNIASELTINAKADGYTILFATIGPIVVNQSLYTNLKFDPSRDLAPITRAVDSTNILVTHPSLPVKNVKELINLSKINSLTCGSSAVGGAGHLANELFNIMANTKIMNVPYKGGGPAMVDLVGGQIQMMFATAASAIPFMNSGRIRSIAVTTIKRASFLPDVPTVSESGVKGFEANNWYGVLAPLKTPRPIIDKLNKEFVAILLSPEIKTDLQKQGLDPTPSSPDEFGAYIHSEVKKWAGVVKTAHIKID
jgi:tripartite-type tricarboxylate transporter receptor subunit TctC